MHKARIVLGETPHIFLM